MSCRNLYKTDDHYNIVWFGVGDIVQKGEEEKYAWFDNNKEQLYVKYKEEYVEESDRFIEMYYYEWFNNKLTVNKIIYKSDKSIDYTATLTINNVSVRFDFQFDESKYKILKIDSETPKRYNYSTLNFEDEESTSKVENNYSYKQEAVKNDLIQRLSVLKGELWYKSAYGLPLSSKIRNKGIMDSVVINIISECPGVKSIQNFQSSLTREGYTFGFTILTIYSDEEINISLTSQ